MAKILIIDDMPGVRMTVEAFLLPFGHELVETGDAREGLELFQKGHFDLVITDLLMPSLDGNAVIEHIKATESPPPVLAITGGGNTITSNDILQKAQNCADHLLKKPFSREELIESVDKLLQRRS